MHDAFHFKLFLQPFHNTAEEPVFWNNNKDSTYFLLLKLAKMSVGQLALYIGATV